MATRGRKPRKSKYRPRGGPAVSVRPHTRSPRGRNARKPKQRIRPYRRNRPRRG